MSDGASIGTFLAAVASLGILFVVVFLVLYVLKSIGLATMAVNRGIEHPWLAWLPVADLYIMGTLVGEINLFGLQIGELGLWYPVIVLMGTMLSSIPFLGIIFVIGLIIFQVSFIYYLFKKYTEQAALYTVLSIFFGFLWPIFIFTLRNNPMAGIQDLPADLHNTSPFVTKDINENESEQVLAPSISEEIEEDYLEDSQGENGGEFVAIEEESQTENLKQ